MPRVFTKREKIIFSATIGVFIFAVIFNLFFVPVLNRNDTLSRELSFTRAKLVKYTQLLGKKDTIRNKYGEFASTFKAPSKQEDTLVDSLTELENLSKQSNIKILDIRPQAPKNLGLYREILIDLRTEGSMENYLKFIYNLENSLSLLRIIRFQLSSRPNTPTLEGSFSISQLSLIP
jgi:Tfp pilus assembly protein PilO